MTIEDIEKEVLEWQTNTFPCATMKAKMLKLREECIELIAAIEFGNYQQVVEEAADVFIVSVNIANDRREFEDNVTMTRVIADKLAVNKARTWGPEQPDGNRKKEIEQC